MKKFFIFITIMHFINYILAILITNFTYQEIKKFEERIYDRLKDNGTIINFNGKSYRKITKSK